MCDRYPQRRFAWLYHKQPQRFSWLYHKQPRRFLWLYQKQPHRFSWLYHKQPRRFLWLYHKQPRRFSWLYHKQPGRFLRMYQKHPTKLKCKRKHMQTSSKRKQSCRVNEKTEICKKSHVGNVVNVATRQFCGVCQKQLSNVKSGHVCNVVDMHTLKRP